MSGVNSGAASLEAAKTSGAKVSGKAGDPKAVKATDPPRKGSKPEGGGIDLATNPTGNHDIVVMTVTKGPAELTVPPATVPVEGIRQAFAEGFAVRFAPVAEETGNPVMGDGYYAGGVTDVHDPANKEFDKMAGKFGLAPTPRMSEGNWNQRLGDSLFVGAGMTVSGASSDGTMGGVLEQLSEKKVRVIKAGKDVPGSEKSYEWGGRQSFNKMGQRQLSAMETHYASPDLRTLAESQLPTGFDKLPDTPENRAMLVQALTNALVPDISAGMMPHE